MPFSQCTYLGFPRIFEPINYSAGGCEVLNPFCSAVNGYRYQLFRTLNETLTTWYVDYDYFTASAPEYLFIARADLLENLSDIEIESSSDNITYNVQDTISAPLTLEGHEGRDFLYTNDSLTPARYWRVRLNFSTGSQVQFSKILLGNLFDLTKPFSSATTENVEFDDSAEFRSSSNYLVRKRKRKPITYYNLRYEQLSDSVIGAFISQVLYKQKRFCLFLTENSNAYFNGFDFHHCIIGEVEITKNDFDKNDIIFSLEVMNG